MALIEQKRDHVQPDHYDGFAKAYADDNESNLFNAYYERPAMLELAGDVDGRRVLDVGCGSGILFSTLQAKGARVTGFDASPAMVELARDRLGVGANIHIADLAERLPFDDAAFDDAIASLVLHYLPDWTGPLAELRRVLRPGGRLLLSVNHPAIFKLANLDADYFAATEYSEAYTFSGETAVLTYWHRPLHAMASAFTDAGFRISVISEPPLAAETPPALIPADLNGRTRFLCFIFFVLEAA